MYQKKVDERMEPEALMSWRIEVFSDLKERIRSECLKKGWQGQTIEDMGIRGCPLVSQFFLGSEAIQADATVETYGRKDES